MNNFNGNIFSSKLYYCALLLFIALPSWLPINQLLGMHLETCLIIHTHRTIHNTDNKGAVCITIEFSILLPHIFKYRMYVYTYRNKHIWHSYNKIQACFQKCIHNVLHQIRKYWITVIDLPGINKKRFWVIKTLLLQITPLCKPTKIFRSKTNIPQLRPLHNNNICKILQNFTSQW